MNYQFVFHCHSSCSGLRRKPDAGATISGLEGDPAIRKNRLNFKPALSGPDDGKWIAYFSDSSGEYELQLRQQNGLGEVRHMTLGQSPSFYYSPVWSPDRSKNCLER